MGLRGAAMELFLKLFGDLLVFVYHCFDRIVIHGYLSGLSRPEQVVHFFRRVVGVPAVTKEVLSQRTADYQNWVEAFARNHDIPIEWAEKGVRKEDYVQPWLRKMVPASGESEGDSCRGYMEPKQPPGRDRTGACRFPGCRRFRRIGRSLSGRLLAIYGPHQFGQPFSSETRHGTGSLIVEDASRFATANWLAKRGVHGDGMGHLRLTHGEFLT